MHSTLHHLNAAEMHLDDTKATRQKEKKRTEFINKAFSDLRKCIPNVPPDTKLSKIKTLRLASSYIAYLSDILENSDPGDSRNGKEFHADFKDLRTRDRRKFNHSRAEESKSKAGMPMKKRKKGRTGWPEAVWAEALETGETNSQQEKAKWDVEKVNVYTAEAPITYVNQAPNLTQPHLQVVRKAKFISEFEVVLNQFNPVQNPNIVIDNTPIHFDENHDMLDYNSNQIAQTNTGHLMYQQDTTCDIQQQVMPLNTHFQTLPSISTMSYGEKIIIDPLRQPVDQDFAHISCFSESLLKQGEVLPHDMQDMQSETPELIELQPVIFQTPS